MDALIFKLKILLFEFYDFDAPVPLGFGGVLGDIDSRTGFAAGDDFDAAGIKSEACRVILNRLAAFVGKQHIVFFRAVPVGMAYENHLEVGI